MIVQNKVKDFDDEFFGDKLFGMVFWAGREDSLSRNNDSFNGNDTGTLIVEEETDFFDLKMKTFYTVNDSTEISSRDRDKRPRVCDFVMTRIRGIMLWWCFCVLSVVKIAKIVPKCRGDIYIYI